VVAARAVGGVGQWHGPEDGLWHFIDDGGLVRGFVLAGKQTARRAEMSSRLAV
jgi:hypothetical protein